MLVACNTGGPDVALEILPTATPPPLVTEPAGPTTPLSTPTPAEVEGIRTFAIGELTYRAEQPSQCAPRPAFDLVIDDGSSRPAFASSFDHGPVLAMHSFGEEAGASVLVVAGCAGGDHVLWEGALTADGTIDGFFGDEPENAPLPEGVPVSFTRMAGGTLRLDYPNGSAFTVGADYRTVAINEPDDPTDATRPNLDADPLATTPLAQVAVFTSDPGTGADCDGQQQLLFVRPDGSRAGASAFADATRIDAVEFGPRGRLAIVYRCATSLRIVVGSLETEGLLALTHQAVEIEAELTADVSSIGVVWTDANSVRVTALSDPVIVWDYSFPEDGGSPPETPEVDRFEVDVNAWFDEPQPVMLSFDGVLLYAMGPDPRSATAAGCTPGRGLFVAELESGSSGLATEPGALAGEVTRVLGLQFNGVAVLSQCDGQHHAQFGRRDPATGAIFDLTDAGPSILAARYPDEAHRLVGMSIASSNSVLFWVDTPHGLDSTISRLPAG